MFQKEVEARTLSCRAAGCQSLRQRPRTETLRPRAPRRKKIRSQRLSKKRCLPRTARQASAQPFRPSLNCDLRLTGGFFMLPVGITGRPQICDVPRKVLEENIKLSRELRMARAELELGEMRECWQEEVEFWKREVMNLEAEIQEQRNKREEATESTSSRKAAEVPSEVRSEVVALSRAERELAELAREQARCEAAAKEVEGRNATLRRSLKQSGLERGGAARLFVNALPALDAQAVEVARTALNAHMQKMKLQSQPANS
ncbi:unnamed protein product [Symbiodinium sp. CCMP2592]|nr:unnamed protein product [Symbiodinium sp. CCMP2592]